MQWLMVLTGPRSSVDLDHYEGVTSRQQERLPWLPAAPVGLDSVVAFFFSLDDAGPQLSRRIDTKLARPLLELPGESGDMQSLALRNLRRGAAFELPSGERVAEHIGVKPLTDADLGFDDPGPAPLWFYVLQEADKERGKHLGEVGGTIVAETLLGLLRNDPLSYFSVQPDWRPTLGPEPENFGIADLLRFAVPEQTQRR